MGRHQGPRIGPPTPPLVLPWAGAAGLVRRTRRRRVVLSARQAPAQELLGLLGALAALCLGPAEELREVAVAVPLGILDVGLQAQGVAQTRLGKPDQVVVLVLGAGDLTGFRARHRALSSRIDGQQAVP